MDDRRERARQRTGRGGRRELDKEKQLGHVYKSIDEESHRPELGDRKSGTSRGWEGRTDKSHGCKEKAGTWVSGLSKEALHQAIN